jgi:dTDP-4-amino-4,6-dideoxygalactose transaminase
MNLYNPYLIVGQAEELLADYAGSKYAVCVESGSAAILLSLFWQRTKTGDLGVVSCPKRTYPSIPCSIILMGGKVQFRDEDWHGTYKLDPYPIVDGALRFRRGMYEKGTLHMLSMHIRKHIPVGRGGAILTDDKDAYEFLKRARFDGRGPVPLQNDEFTQLGFNAYMEPSNAARAIQLIQALGDRELPDLKVEDQKYPDLSKFSVYQQ